MSLPPQLYEHLLTVALQHLVQERADGAQVELEDLDSAESHTRLAWHVAQEVARALRAIGGDRADRVRRQAEVANALLAHLRTLASPEMTAGADISQPPQMLLSIHDGIKPVRTALPYSVSSLLTRSRGEPALGHELIREVTTADRIDAIVSFVTSNGVRALREALERHAQAGKAFRLLTTTYIGATDAEAVEFIARLPGTQVRVSYDARRTRLHAKAWLFSRENGLDTAYVGSANLSQAALFHGHEWMVKAAAGDMPAVLDKFRGTFESLWNDPEFEPFDVTNEADRDRLRSALRAEKGGGAKSEGQVTTFFTLSPYPFQADILDRLDAERSIHGRRRNLVVAATGTGKTVISAFDYQRRIGADGRRPRLLFLAHREELLTQALMTFRQVLRDGSFGSVLAGGAQPDSFDHLFATIQSFNSRGLLDRFGPSHWDHVVIDECHHAPADSYRWVVEHVTPSILVGLTATPERSDGQSLLGDFDGHIAAELRLWHALERQLLVPFEYYGLSDNTDLRGARWARGAYHTEDLDKIYTGNDRRAELVFEQALQRIGDLHQMRALGFCVSVAHAEFMARKFTEFGVPAIAIQGGSAPEVRKEAPRRLERGEVNVIFTCDLYNEGVDLPFVDTLLLLRPTSSATLFLQQLGRGLRLHPSKTSCLVLDFIGQQREDFRFDGVLSALTGQPRGALRHAIQHGFPLLPTGCHLALDRVAQEQVLASLQRSLRGGVQRLSEELRILVQRHGAEVSLAQFLEDTGRTVDEVFDGKLTWSRLRRAAGLAVPPEGPDDAVLGTKLRQLTHLDDPNRLAFYRGVLMGDVLVGDDLTHQRQLLMLAYQLFHEPTRFLTPGDLLALLKANPAIQADLNALFELLLDRVGMVANSPLPHPNWPLVAHRQYDRREILAAVGRWNENAKPPSREGVVRIEEARTELLLVTLEKGEKHFSPTTSYEDYAISADLFHWQSQSLVSPQSQSGQRYICQNANGWQFLLFVRATVDDVYTYLGPVQYVQHTGSRPMSITWRMEIPIPGRWLQEYARLVS